MAAVLSLELSNGTVKAPATSPTGHFWIWSLSVIFSAPRSALEIFPFFRQPT